MPKFAARVDPYLDHAPDYELQSCAFFVGRQQHVSFSHVWYRMLGHETCEWSGQRVQNSSMYDVYHSSAFELGMMTNFSRHKITYNTALVVYVAVARGVVGVVCELGPS